MIGRLDHSTNGNGLPGYLTNQRPSSQPSPPMGTEVIDLTFSSSEAEVEENEEADSSPFNPPINVSGNILTSRHYRILSSMDGAWFTDDLVNAFFCKLQHEFQLNETKFSHKFMVYSSFFYESLRNRSLSFLLEHWTKDLEPFLSNPHPKQHRLLLIPVNSNESHWALACWRIDEGVLEYYDSLMSKRTGTKILGKLGKFFNSFIEMEQNSKKSLDVEVGSLGLEFLNLNQADLNQPSSLPPPPSPPSLPPLIHKIRIPANQPQQTDGSSCGVFVCCFGDCLVRRDGMLKTPSVQNLFLLNQSAVDGFRQTMIEYFLDWQYE